MPVLDKLAWRLLRMRWSQVGVSECVTLVLDSTVAVRYGAKQAGAEEITKDPAVWIWSSSGTLHGARLLLLEALLRIRGVQVPPAAAPLGPTPYVAGPIDVQ